MHQTSALVRPDLVVKTAREWIGTPYRDQGSTRAGCDCRGLMIGLCVELGLAIAADRYDYAPEPSGAEMLRYLRANCTMIDFDTAAEAPPAAILAYRVRGDQGPHHLALRTPTGLLHAWDRAVVETGLAMHHRLHSVWWHPGVLL
jgi:hypothetical protein